MTKESPPKPQAPRRSRSPNGVVSDKPIPVRLMPDELTLVDEVAHKENRIAASVLRLAALTFWFGALQAQSIRASQVSYPSLEIVGEPGAGKTTLIEFLWKLCGRPNYEGFMPCKGSHAACSRNFDSSANLPVVLIADALDLVGLGFGQHHQGAQVDLLSLAARPLAGVGQ